MRPHLPAARRPKACPTEGAEGRAFPRSLSVRLFDEQPQDPPQKAGDFDADDLHTHPPWPEGPCRTAKSSSVPRQRMRTRFSRVTLEIPRVLSKVKSLPEAG